MKAWVHNDKALKSKSAISSTYRQNNDNFASIGFFSFKIKQKNLSFRKVRKGKGASM